jgi:hypothetical protein
MLKRKNVAIKSWYSFEIYVNAKTSHKKIELNKFEIKKFEFDNFELDFLREAVKKVK